MLPINPKITGLIILAVLVYQTILQGRYEFNGFPIAHILIITAIALLCGGCFFVSGKYGWSSNLFGKSYFLIGIGVLFSLIGEVTYHYLESIGIDPYPSIADVFYFLTYPMLIIHVYRNVEYFAGGFSNPDKILLVVIPLVLVGSYVFFSFADLQAMTLDFAVGMVFVSAASIALAFAVVGVIEFRQNVLHVTWMIFAVGISLFTAASVWYFYVELFGTYDYTHPVNSLWMASALVIIYGFFKHLRVL